jgi:hypothetical protein
VNIRHAKNVPGRKTVVRDAEWLRQPHAYGLLCGGFRPKAEIATLRAYTRRREQLTWHAAAYIQHMQKALSGMNLELHHMVPDITGLTGRRIIRPIVAGGRDPEILASFRDVRCKAFVEAIKAALVGDDRDEHVFALVRSLHPYDAGQARIAEREGKPEAAVAVQAPETENGLAPLPEARIRTKRHTAPSFDVRAAL